MAPPPPPRRGLSHADARGDGPGPSIGLQGKKAIPLRSSLPRSLPQSLTLLSRPPSTLSPSSPCQMSLGDALRSVRPRPPPPLAAAVAAADPQVLPPRHPPAPLPPPPLPPVPPPLPREDVGDAGDGGGAPPRLACLLITSRWPLFAESFELNLPALSSLLPLSTSEIFCGEDGARSLSRWTSREP